MVLVSGKYFEGSSFKSSINIILFTVILPTVINFVLASTNAASRDLWIGQVSIVLMLSGVVVMALSGTVSLLITGKDYPK